MSVGILALQGDVAEHRAALAEVGVASRPVRRPEDLRGVRGLVLPGGESTTLSMLLESSGLFDPIAGLLHDGLPALGTCAGLILLSREVLDARPDQRSFAVLDATVRRNGYGRQAQSFEAALDPTPVDAALADSASSTAGAASGEPSVTVSLPGAPCYGAQPLPAVFIRAPRIESLGPTVEVLAELADGATPPPPATPTPVLVRQGPILAAAFHPELTSDRRAHRLFAATLQRTARPQPEDRQSENR